MGRSVFIGLIALAGFGVAVWGAGWFATRPANGPIGHPPEDLPIVDVTFEDATGRTVKGWKIDGDPTKGAVLLIHGIRSNRLSMVNRARMVADAGYSVLLIDLQAHGESEGDRVTFGHREADSVAAALRFSKRQWPGKKVGVMGSSLGGAAAVLASRSERADAYIIEAVYSTLHDAADNRLKIRLGWRGSLLTPLLVTQTSFQLGFDADQLSIVDAIRHIDAPLLMLAGENDDRTTLENSQAIFENAREPKQIWVLEGARHQDFYRFAGDRYKKRVLDFAGRHLN